MIHHTIQTLQRAKKCALPEATGFVFFLVLMTVINFLHFSISLELFVRLNETLRRMGIHVLACVCGTVEKYNIPV